MKDGGFFNKRFSAFDMWSIKKFLSHIQDGTLRNPDSVLVRENLEVSIHWYRTVAVLTKSFNTKC